VVEKVAQENGTQAVAEAYLRYLYSPEAQELIAKYHYRPRLEEVAKKHEADFQKVTLFTIDEVFGGWKSAQKTHFDDGEFSTRSISRKPNNLQKRNHQISEKISDPA